MAAPPAGANLTGAPGAAASPAPVLQPEPGGMIVPLWATAFAAANLYAFFWLGLAVLHAHPGLRRKLVTALRRAARCQRPHAGPEDDLHTAAGLEERAATYAAEPGARLFLGVQQGAAAPGAPWQGRGAPASTPMQMHARGPAVRGGGDCGFSSPLRKLPWPRPCLVTPADQPCSVTAI
jgi:hypothetical protein